VRYLEFAQNKSESDEKGVLTSNQKSNPTSTQGHSKSLNLQSSNQPKGILMNKDSIERSRSKSNDPSNQNYVVDIGRTGSQSRGESQPTFPSNTVNNQSTHLINRQQYEEMVSAHSSASLPLQFNRPPQNSYLKRDNMTIDYSRNRPTAQ
jgi:hypothetical protein